MNVSLDGYIEGPNHDLSWANDDFAAFSPEQSMDVDTILLGRKTYDMMKSFWPTPQAETLAPGVARFMNETRKLVASRRDFEPGWENVTVIHDAVADVKPLRAQPGNDIIILGSNTLCASLVQAGLIDEIQVMVNPVVLGTGTSLFAGLPEKVKLMLVEARPFSAGRVLLIYTRAA
jgi:dihydrofolate reductase